MRVEEGTGKEYFQIVTAGCKNALQELRHENGDKNPT